MRSNRLSTDIPAGSLAWCTNLVCVLRDPTLAILAMSFSDSEEYDESLEHDLAYVSQLQTIGEKIYDSLTDDDKVARLIM